LCVLTRYKMPLLAHLDQATGLPVRRPKALRYEAAAPTAAARTKAERRARPSTGRSHRHLAETRGERARLSVRPDSGM